MQRIVECSSASAYVSMRQRKSAYVWIRLNTSEYVSVSLPTSEYAGPREVWSENSMVRSFFIAFLALKWIKKFFNSWVIVVKIPRFGRVSLWALPYGGDFFTPQMLALAFYDVLCCFQHWNRGGGGHRIDQRGYGIDAPGLFVLTHQGQVNIWRWIALDFCLKFALAFDVCAHRLMRTYTSTYAYVRLNTPRLRQGASEAPLKRLWGASEAPLRSASEAPQKRLWRGSPESAKFDEFQKTLSKLTENGAKNPRKREKLLSFWERKFSQSTVNSQQLKRNIHISL